MKLFLNFAENLLYMEKPSSYNRKITSKRSHRDKTVDPILKFLNQSLVSLLFPCSFKHPQASCGGLCRHQLPHERLERHGGLGPQLRGQSHHPQEHSVFWQARWEQFFIRDSGDRTQEKIPKMGEQCNKHIYN